MDNKRAELLEYIRLLYNRQNDEASKAGVTFWAVLVGIVYVSWEVLDLISKLSNFQEIGIYIYYAFGLVHLVLLTICIFISSKSPDFRRKSFDYRVTNNRNMSLKTAILLLLTLGLPLFCVYQSFQLGNLTAFQLLQLEINYWTLLIFLSLFLFAMFFEFFMRLKTKFPLVSDLELSRNSLIFRGLVFLFSLLVFEIFVGNFYIVVTELSNPENAIKYKLVLNVSLISYGLYFLLKKSEKDEYLSRLVKLERDVIMHNLDEDQIVKRLGDEFLGNYIGDWIEDLLREIRQKSDAAVQFSKKSDEVIKDINALDEGHQYEKQGRSNEYHSELKKLSSAFIDDIDPLIEWLEKVNVQLKFCDDEFMKSLVVSSLKELKLTLGKVKRGVEEVEKNFNSN